MNDNPFFFDKEVSKMTSTLSSFRKKQKSSDSSGTFRRSSLLVVTEEADEKSLGSCENDIIFNDRPRTLPVFRQSKEETIEPPKGKCYDLFSSQDSSSSFHGYFDHATFESPFKDSAYLKNTLTTVTPRTVMESPVPSLTLSELSRGTSPFTPSLDTLSRFTPNYNLKNDLIPETEKSMTLKSTYTDGFNSNYFFTPIQEEDDFTSFVTARSNSVSTIGSEFMKDYPNPLPQCRRSSHSESLCEPCLPFENDNIHRGNHVLSMFNKSRVVTPQSCIESTSCNEMHTSRSMLSFMSTTQAEIASSVDLEDHPMTCDGLDFSSDIEYTNESFFADTMDKKQDLLCSPVNSKSQTAHHHHPYQNDLSENLQTSVPQWLDHATTPTKHGARTSIDYDTARTPIRTNGRYTQDFDASTRSSPLPQNLRGDPNRQAKVKTELCRNYSLGLDCPFGSRCNYAHGEDELKYTTLFELERAGLVQDIESYRAYPCFSFVATGSCPYGLRCGNIHDPRVVGKHSSWLPHSEVPVSSLETDLNVDKTHHELLASLSQDNPLVPRLLWDNRPSLKNAAFAVKNDDISTEWKDVYALVCNLPTLKDDVQSKSSFAHKLKISELHRLSIALYMNNDCSHARGYIYKPRHLIYNELCMVLRTKYFRLLHPLNFIELECVSDRPPLSHLAQEISNSEYERSRSLWNENENVVVVHELAFGCAGEQAARVSLWFDIEDVTDMSIADVKKFKRQKQRLRNEERVAPYPGTGSSSYTEMGRSIRTSNRVQTPYSFETHPHKPFFYAHPINNDEVARTLVTDIVYHRLSVLLYREFKCFSGREADVRELISRRDQSLKEKYFKLKASIKKWTYPVTKGLESLTEKTVVPKCNSYYEPSSSINGMEIKNIWLSFTKSFRMNDEAFTRSTEIFSMLRKGKSVSEHSQSLPRIKEFDESVIFSDEWRLIQEHYQVSSNVQNPDNGMPLSPSVLEKRAEKKD